MSISGVNESNHFKNFEENLKEYDKIKYIQLMLKNLDFLVLKYY